jgi:Uma2 family endonuclease
MGPSSPRSNEVAAEVMRRVGNHVREHRLGRFGGSEGGFLLEQGPDTLRVPDVWFVQGERVPSGKMPDKFFDGTPDLVVEVLSPSDRTRDIWKRVAQYLETGCRLVVVIDPFAEAAVVFPPEGFPRIIGREDVFDFGDVLPGLSFVLGEIFEI